MDCLDLLVWVFCILYCGVLEFYLWLEDLVLLFSWSCVMFEDLYCIFFGD